MVNDRQLMKNLAFASFGTLLLALSLVVGCASDAAKPAAQPSSSQPVSAAATPAAKPAKPVLPPGVAQPPAPFPGEGWQPMFDGHSLVGWRETAFPGRGEVECHSGVVVLNLGDPFTGINWTNDFPRVNYEVALDAMRLTGSDFFCGLTVPVGTNFCSLIVGGWGGSLVGISSLDGMDASENETTQSMNFDSGRWYRIRLRVTQAKIQAWIDDEKLVDVVTTGRRISVRPGDIELSEPLGLAAWQTATALREIKFRRVSGPAGKGD
jgi:hypothetical protein